MTAERYTPIFGTAALIVFFAALVSPAAAQQSDDEWLESCQRNRDDRSTWCNVQVQQLSARSTLRIDASPNGGIEVIGSNRNDIEVHARIQARAESSADARDLGESVRVDFGNTISSDGPSTGRNESWHVTFVVYVPEQIDLDLEANNGPLGVSGVEGRIEATTRNGPLSLRDLAGDVHARTRNGPLSVTLDGSTWDGAGLDAETTNGPLTLVIPEDYSAELETGTARGPFQSDVPLTVTRLGRSSRRIETTLGRGGAPVRVVTTNGPVTIRNR